MNHATYIKILRVSIVLFIILIILVLCRLLPTTSLPTSAAKTQTPAEQAGLTGQPPPAVPAPTNPIAGKQPAIKWILDVIDPGPRVGIFSSLIQAQNGIQYVAYLDDQFDSLKLAMNNGIQWGAKTILYEETSTGWYPSLAIDREGRLHVSVLNLDQQQILYGTMADNGSWSFTQAASGVTASDTTLLFGADGQPTIVFYNETTSEVQYV
ncbi:MAG: hypothetical protein IH586_05585, partial [Anaerolineaceae bacterium]|nr:hypothetical protein [Anaerolineaceae bacterium]